jgi:thiol:disulfide interchange protein DsbA
MQLNRRQFLGAIGAATAATTLPALTPAMAQGAFEADKDFRVVNPPQPTNAGGKIEVVEFFWYGCPHCFAFEPTLNAWVAKLPADVSFRRIPAQFGPIWTQHAKIFFALDAIGEEQRVHKKVFDTIHVDRVMLDTDDQVIDWAGKNGIDKAKMADALKSFGVAGKLKSAQQVVGNYGIDGVPALAINGKYLTAPSMARGEQKALAVADYLIGQERAKKKA